MKKKGFTLIELIIVIAIIGILAAVLIPSWGAYIRNGRTRSQNLKARTVFNAAQSAVTDMKFSEKMYMNTYLSATDEKIKKEAQDRIYASLPDNEWYYYWDGTNGYQTDASGKALDSSKWKTVKSNWNNNIADSINRIINEDELVYRIYVKDYKVMSVVTARSANDPYLGTYPTTLNVLEENGEDVDSIRDGRILKADMSKFVLP